MKYPVMTGDEQFISNSQPLSSTVKDFWAWAMSRLLGDGPRGNLAEFIVNTALGVDTTDAKHGWGECDILYGGYRVEVKCSSMLQAWDRSSPSKPVFSISKTLNCDVQETEAGYRYVGHDGLPPERRSEMYVFCLFANTDRSTANPLNLDQWKFFVVPTSLINEKCGNRRSITIQGLSQLGISSCHFCDIRAKADHIISELKRKEQPQEE